MSWTMSLIGFESTLDMLDGLEFEFGDGVTYVVGPTVRYAVFHELGTSKMEARPFARPAAEEVEANVEEEIQPYLTNSILESSEEALVKAAALAVQNKMQTIIKQKGIIDTGTMWNSVSVQPV